LDLEIESSKEQLGGKAKIKLRVGGGCASRASEAETGSLGTHKYTKCCWLLQILPEAYAGEELKFQINSALNRNRWYRGVTWLQIDQYTC
jgi:hypothetical protein